MGFNPFEAVGGLVNNLLGGTTSAKQAQKYALQQQAYQNIYNKETMQNLHQWEVEDLKKAGLNPALGYGGNTSGIATGTASGPQSATGDPISMLATAVGIGNQLKQMDLTSAEKTKTDADTTKSQKEAELIEAQKIAQLTENNFISDAKKAEIANMNANSELQKAEKKFTNERSRGYTDTESRSTGSNFWGLGHNSARTVSKTR